jgi:hypothetical protein
MTGKIHLILMSDIDAKNASKRLAVINTIVTYVKYGMMLEQSIEK